MHRRTRAGNWVGLISIVVCLTSCTSAFQTGSPIPDTGPTIAQVYEEHMTMNAFGQYETGMLHDGGSGLEGYSRDVYNELSVHFPRLPNPTIIMYVFPHLSFEGTPVPGYSTMFQLYPRTHYALPGEVQRQ